MDNLKNVRVKSEDELKNILPEELKDEFTIGMHGFDSDDRYWKKDENGNYTLNQEEIQKTKDLILNKGLNFIEGRTLLSTVRFNELENYISTEGYSTAGGVIIALPKVLKNENDEELFVGGPNEKSVQDRNHEITSLSEVLLPEENYLDSQFIIGSYSKDKDGIEVSLNPEHIAFHKGIVSNEYYKNKKQTFTQIKDNIPQSVLDETNAQKKSYQANHKNRSNGRFGRLFQRIKSFLSNIRNPTKALPEQKEPNYIEKENKLDKWKVSPELIKNPLTIMREKKLEEILNRELKTNEDTYENIIEMHEMLRYPHDDIPNADAQIHQKYTAIGEMFGEDVLKKGMEIAKENQIDMDEYSVMNFEDRNKVQTEILDSPDLQKVLKQLRYHPEKRDMARKSGITNDYFAVYAHMQSTTEKEKNIQIEKEER